MKMAQNKLETQIKEKLNSREINPTEKAWDRLDAMLSVAEQKPKKQSFKFIGIAASVLLFLSIGFYNFNKNKTEIQTIENVVVNEAEKEATQENSSINQNNTQNQKKINKIINQKTQQLVQINQNQKVNISNPLINKDTEIEHQNTEVIAQKEMPKISFQEKIVQQKTVSVNVDDLLASVEKPTKKETKSTIKVNYNSLLSQVDGELDRTFRQKVIDKIAKNYQEVKVAIANRNQE